jgi:hypothetical protein
MDAKGISGEGYGVILGTASSYVAEIEQCETLLPGYLLFREAGTEMANSRE